jgi:formyltetrahydrofolate synthetase
MVYTRRQKQALAAVSNPLKDAGILQHVFSFLPGNWLFLGAVCSEWRVVYVGVADQQLRSIKRNIRGEQKLVTCSARTTLFSAAVASSITAVLAASCGLPER